MKRIKIGKESEVRVKEKEIKDSNEKEKEERCIRYKRKVRKEGKKN